MTQAADASGNSATRPLPRLVLSDGAIEVLKWLGVLAMVGDHVNKYLLAEHQPALFAMGRVVMPLFAIVLAYNLARPGALERGVYSRVLKRLASFGAVASVPFIALGGLGWMWWPLNIMATLLVAAAAMYLIELGGSSRRLAAVLLLLVGGALVEYWWPALAIAMAAWSYTKRPSWPALLVGAVGFISLYPINHNWWALAALPLVAIASKVDLQLPRLRWAFYALYPAHLAAIWVIRVVTSH